MQLFCPVLLHICSSCWLLIRHGCVRTIAQPGASAAQKQSSECCISAELYHHFSEHEGGGGEEAVSSETQQQAVLLLQCLCTLPPFLCLGVAVTSYNWPIG
jgi:hypothetical protein